MQRRSSSNGFPRRGSLCDCKLVPLFTFSGDLLTDRQQLLLSDSYLQGTSRTLNITETCLLELYRRCIGVGTFSTRCWYEEEVGSARHYGFGFCRCDGPVTSTIEPADTPPLPLIISRNCLTLSFPSSELSTTHLPTSS